MPRGQGGTGVQGVGGDVALGHTIHRRSRRGLRGAADCARWTRSIENERWVQSTKAWGSVISPGVLVLVWWPQRTLGAVSSPAHFHSLHVSESGSMTLTKDWYSSPRRAKQSIAMANNNPIGLLDRCFSPPSSWLSRTGWCSAVLDVAKARKWLFFPVGKVRRILGRRHLRCSPPQCPPARPYPGREAASVCPNTKVGVSTDYNHFSDVVEKAQRYRF